MEFEWDPSKAEANSAKHGVRFSDAVAVLYDPFAMTVCDDQPEPEPEPEPEEERFVTVGADAFGRVLVVVYTWRDSRIRLISARRASRRELQQYQEQA